MRVLHFFKTYYPDSFGGIEQVIYQLAEGGRQFGIESEVLSLSRSGVARQESLASHIVHRSKLDFYIASTGFSFSAFRDFAELARQADVVHYHFPWPYMDVVHFATRIKKPSVLSYHSDIVKQKTLLQFYRPLMYRFMDSVSRIVASSPNYLATSPVLQRYTDKVSVIPYGLDKANYPIPAPERLSFWRQRMGEKFFLFVGVLRYYKGLHILLDALRDVDYHVAIVGTGPVEADLKAQAQRLGLKNIHFLGALPDEDKVALLELCYGVVFPSHLRSEAFGISLLEGAMYGKPMISCEIGTGTTYINLDGDTGLVVPPTNPEALRAAMHKLWNDPALAREMGSRAEQRYLHVFTAEKMVAQYSSLYREVVELSELSNRT
ncbi:glycosyltransferase family 4 protein [Crenobacter sp. SG2303]|uniref:Glycosyltransferase family 4 protein n=1 Tax=Crenobacter oryzisoli TaxID=3056844 RepID=A0ABT7XSS0_9NEIS|nr:glycosyltransferase family 4 protein [Crenobacter sp. SG2303]MDN0076847.1 glycosyltransferase family 4 protein [Crenobacter sp. SG2303]